MMKNLRSLGVVVMVLVAVVALGILGGGQLWLGVYAESAALVPAGGNSAQPGTIVSTGVGTGAMMPAVISGGGAAGQVTFWTGTESLSGDNGFFWDNTNKRLGIGTVSPLRKLHYYGDAALFQRDVDAAGFIIQRTDTNRWVFGASENPSLGTGFSIYTYPVGAPSATPRLFIDLNGRVGIGTTSPTRKLDVQTDSGTAVYGQVTSGGTDYGVYGKHNASNNYGYLGSSGEGVYGNSSNKGVYGQSSAGQGVYGQYGTAGNYGWLGGSSYGAYGIHSVTANWGSLGDSDFGVHGEGTGSDFGVYGRNTVSNNQGYLGSQNDGAHGHNDNGNWGALGDDDQGVYGFNGTSNNFGYLGNGVWGAYGKHAGQSNLGGLGGEYYGVYGEAGTDTTVQHYGVYGKHNESENYGYIASIDYGVFGYHDSTDNYGYIGGSNYAVYGDSSSGYAGFFNGKVKLNGSITTAFVTRTSSYTAGDSNSIIAVNANDNDVTITLPAASGCGGRVYTIKRVDGSGYSASVARTGSDTIDAAASYGLTQWKYVTVVSDGVNKWLVVGGN